MKTSLSAHGDINDVPTNEDGHPRQYVSHSGEFGNKKDTYFFEKSFPILFPYGIGGPKTLKVGPQRWCQEFVLDDEQNKEPCLRQNISFLALIYSYLQDIALNTGIYVLKKRGTINAITEQLESISKEDIEDEHIVNRSLVESDKNI